MRKPPAQGRHPRQPHSQQPAHPQQQGPRQGPQQGHPQQYAPQQYPPQQGHPVAPQAAPSRTLECSECGAPPMVGLAACKYCKTAYPGVQSGVRCPRCADVNVHGSVSCVSCRTSLAVGCVFCGTASPLDRPACVRCGEAFAGSAERKQARDTAAQQARYVGLATDGVRVLGTAIATAPPGTGSAILDALGGLLGDVIKD